MKLFREIQGGGIETMESNKLVKGWKKFPNEETLLERLRVWYSFQDLLDIIGYTEDKEEEQYEDFADFRELKSINYGFFVDAVERYCINNGNFEECLLSDNRPF